MKTWHCALQLVRAGGRSHLPPARISPFEAEQFLSELGSLTAQGQDLPCSLQVLAGRKPVGSSQRALQQVSDLVAAGAPLGEALAHFPAAFSPMVLAVLQTGEQPQRLALAAHLCLVHHALSGAMKHSQWHLLRTGGLAAALIVLQLGVM